MVAIVRLTEEKILEAVDLVNAVFPGVEGEPPKEELPSSIHPEVYPDFFSRTGIRPGLEYWLAIEGEKVVGTIGLYCYNHDAKEAYWLGWFTVAPAKREQGIGSVLLRFAIEEAKRRGKSYLRIYTGDNAEERAAHRLYERNGFRVTGRDPEAEVIYYELKL